MATELVGDEPLKSAAAAAKAKFEHQAGYAHWLPGLAEHIRKTQEASHAEFMTPEFQRALWDSEAVSATGMGRIDVSELIAQSEVAQMLWEFRNLSLAAERETRAQQIKAAWDQFSAQVDARYARQPRLKMYRVFAALFPKDFTTVAHLAKLRKLARAMGINTSGPTGQGVFLHSWILKRLEEVLGPVTAPPSDAGVERMSLPWLLYAAFIQEQGDEATVIDDPASGTEKLNPLPAARRRKGLTAMRGYVDSLLSMIEFAKDGCTREDMREHMGSVNPQLSVAARNTNINALIGELGVVKATGNDLKLTSRGEAFLDSGDPAELSDWLLTRILGFDHLLVYLRGKSILQSELEEMLQSVNPGWTTRFAPNAMIRWAKSLGLIESDSAGIARLTTEGSSWASRVHWLPEKLTKEDGETLLAVSKTTGISSSPVTVWRPSLDEIFAAFPKNASFAKALVARLDAGLWHNDLRHFAVLAGLSGAGKTLLARSYGRAMWAGKQSPGDGMLVVPVQPGWYDPSAILGYVSPLQEDRYVRTGVLDFLLRAVGDPGRAYTLVLDEMNLSRPEQYLAPLLSAMETGDPIQLHTADEEMNGVPPFIVYPANLLIIGTVNMDETTHGLSDKVLDRACVIDFWKIDVDAYPGWHDCGLDPAAQELVRGVLVRLGKALEPVRLHFGWRTVADVIGYVRTAVQAGNLPVTQALDHAIYGKVLTKMRGESTERLRNAFQASMKELSDSGLTDSAKKVTEMFHDLEWTGSARFWR